MRKLGTILVIAVAALVLAGCAAGGSRYAATVSGAVNHDLGGGQVYYEPVEAYVVNGERVAPTRQVYLEQPGPGDDHHLLILTLPGSGLRAGQWSIAGPNAGPVPYMVLPSAEYFDATGGVSRIFNQEVTGQLIVEDSPGDALTATFTITATAENSDDRVTIEGHFDGVPYTGVAVGGSTAGGRTPRRAVGTAASALVLGLFGLLVVANLAFQLYIGSKVYAGQGAAVLRSLRGTRTFIRGWQLEDEQLVMVAWSVALAGLLLLVCLLGVAAAMTR